MPTPVTIPSGFMSELRDTFSQLGAGVGFRGYQAGVAGGSNVNLSPSELKGLRKSLGGEQYNESGYATGHDTDTSSYGSRTFGGKAGIYWSKTPDDAFEELVLAYAETIESTLREMMKDYAEDARAWMVMNAPWKDRSGAARSGLGARPGGNQHGAWLVLFHTAPHGIYLEGINPKTSSPMVNAGEFDIIGPAVDHFGEVIWSAVEALFRS